jgi:phenylalanyl-tRNA synthetase beta chain
LLDGKEVALTTDTLVIADDQKAVAMAELWVASSAPLGRQPQDIFLESAFFAPLAIAGRARQLRYA